MAAPMSKADAAAGPVLAHLNKLRAGKVEVHVKAMGSAPALRQPRFTIDGCKKFSKLIMYLKEALKLETIYVYCNDAFEPSPDERLSDLQRCFGSSGNKLNISYAGEQAFN